MSILDSFENFELAENNHSEINFDEINDLISEIEDLTTKKENFNNYLIIIFLLSIVGLNLEDINNFKNLKDKELVIFNQYFFTNKNIYYEYLNLFHYYLIIFILYVQSRNYPM